MTFVVSPRLLRRLWKSPVKRAKYRWGRFELVISTREHLQLCGSDAVSPQISGHPPQSMPTTPLHWQSNIGLMLSTTSSRSWLWLLCLFQLTVCLHGSTCISRASCSNPVVTRVVDVMCYEPPSYIWMGWSYKPQNFACWLRVRDTKQKK